VTVEYDDAKTKPQDYFLKLNSLTYVYLNTSFLHKAGDFFERLTFKTGSKKLKDFFENIKWSIESFGISCRDADHGRICGTR